VRELLANLKRLFGSPTPPAETVRQPTEDRPPPGETARAPEPATRNAIPTDDVSDDLSDDVLEVRALLESVAEPPVEAPETEAEFPAPVSEPEADLEPEPVREVQREPELEAEPVAEAESAPAPITKERTVEAPTTAPGRAGEVLVLTLGTPPATFTVEKSSATLGRGQENTIRLDDLSVSRRHARIAYRQGGYWISDLGSMGGTWVNGTRLNAPRRIAAAEVIDIGLCRLTVSFAGGAARSEAKKSASKRSEMAGDARRRR